MSSRNVLAGILVGGKSRRMGGTPKGLLRLPTSNLNLIQNLVEQLRLADIEAICLVGEARKYEQLGLPIIPDSDSGNGPMAGLLSLFELSMQEGYEQVLAIACDMPNVDAPFISRLLQEQVDAAAVVPKRTYWEPLCARYCVRKCLPALQAAARKGNFRLYHFIETLGTLCSPLLLDEAENVTLADWDSPEDLPPGYRFHLQALGDLGRNTRCDSTEIEP